jgi:hypothetical protein
MYFIIILLIVLQIAVQQNSGKNLCYKIKLLLNFITKIIQNNNLFTTPKKQKTNKHKEKDLKTTLKYT